MCWSAAVSLNTYLLTSFTILLVLWNKQQFDMLPLFMFIYGIMQLNEFFLWTFLDNPQLNMLFSIVAAIIIAIQPLVVFITIKSKKGFIIYLILYILFLVMFISSFFGTNLVNTFKTEVAKNGHLKWNWTQKVEYITFLLYIVLLISPLLFSKLWVPLGLTLLTLFISLWTYYEDETWTSMWCWFANIVAFYLLGKIFFYDTFCRP